MQTATAFNTVGDNDSAFDYGAMVEEAYTSFPDIVKKVFFIDLLKMKTFHPDAGIRQKIVDSVNRNEDLLKTIHTCAQNKKSCCYGNFVLLYPRADQIRLMGQRTPLVQELCFIFDHELAHALIPDGNDEENRNTPQAEESIADAYGALRHFQRFGLSTGGVETLMNFRALRLFTVQPEEDLCHFTSPVLEKILEQKDKIDYTALSPQETARLARRFALHYSMNAKKSEILKWHLDEFYREHGQKRDEGRNRAFAEWLLLTDQPDIFKWGASVLQGLLDGFYSDAGIGGPIRHEGDFWDDVRTQLKKRRQEYNANPILFGMETRQKPEKIVNNLMSFPKPMP